jgi:hypothetical protein
VGSGWTERFLCDEGTLGNEGPGSLGKEGRASLVQAGRGSSDTCYRLESKGGAAGARVNDCRIRMNGKNSRDNRK